MRMNGMVRTMLFTFFGTSNGVEHKKLNQVLSFWCSTRPSADTGTDQDQQDKRKIATSYITI